MKNRTKVLIILSLLVVLIFLSLISIKMGSVDIGLKDIIDIIKGQGDSINRGIIIDMRMPRIILAIFVGANLAISGALLQAVMKNPLADPGVTGVSSGASLAAILIMMYFPEMYGILPLVAFIGGIIACSLIYLLAWKDGIDPMRIILSGVAVNAMLGGATSFISIMNSESIQGVLMWLNGSLAARGWKEVQFFIPYTILGLILSIVCIKGANLLGLGDEAASNLGLSVNKTRVLISLVAVFLAAISTSAVGVIGFVGLVVPHISRMIIGSDYKFLIPMSCVLGAIVLLLADSFARTLIRPIELPVGIIMAIIGGPFFLFLLRRNKRNA
ncbi:putative iron (III) dicitrate transport system permease protein [Gottschalkia purinilytica]|uniref:Probable heme-iron transport system permease protein IsdF n=1 Tax=Gottschalkia purinilytica TaxID=1503 RepID=A0A0L0W9Q3_GOTPU|nr:iron ABC transporter permease [Gottschalkia purinilytica]KNF08283.1 putative iron (III) dicitrate transport system permease protein [Gottschalkia purinilytica]